MRRHFRVEQANEMLGAVREELRAARDAQQGRQRAEAELHGYRKRLVWAGGAIPNANRMGAYEDQAKLAHGDLTRAMNRLEDMGVEVKDLEQGVVDFPTRYRGETVYLCYQMGEEEIRFWHGMTEGFRGRKEIDGDFLREHRGDLAQ